ncbi:hypothetical protein [Pseudalkalibacillus sp. SCS-8]|uniref:hypothetical protein n=1 Tax=Pseudalkalibacillus nanhaiensis TaxID=3115291 RepID=UPI0032DBD3AB
MFWFGIGLLVAGFTISVATWFKYKKKQHEDFNHSSTVGDDWITFIFSLLLAVLPWWVAKTVFILIGFGLMFIGILVITE